MPDSSQLSRNSSGLGSFISTVAVGLCVGMGTGILGYHFLRSEAVRLIPAVKVTAQAAPGAQPANAKGSESAPVVLEEFSDFQCPPCRSLYQKLKRVEAEYGSQLKIIYRQYPIASLHKNALEAARAAEAAGLQGHFWEMHDRLFDNQETWASSSDPRSVFIAYAGALGLDTGRFQKDLQAPQTKARIFADQQRGDSIGVPGTPVVLVNGVQVPPTAITYAGIQTAVERELKRRTACSGTCTAPGATP
jgi:protein-disulfide isomerase